ncbi:MAG: xanthine dehydrogenase family protein molybdopterin-binding subunit [Clostridiales bacterium]|jgi:CO/xanthine dehydrogenase Mo-binding subunit|nr:xanthine dehydrogenase family protein molybdopterin-binding subunit [Clostridiales bacterium]
MYNTPKTSYSLVGTAVPRHDAWAKVKGDQAYSDDWAMPGMLYGKVLRSKHAAAILRGVDTSKAEALPGVHAVLTAKDVPNNIDISKFGQMRDVGGGFEGLYKALADGKIRSRGEAIALVAAETEEIAEDALKLIKVDYDVQEGVFDPREALKPGAYIVSSEDTSNKIMETKVEKGNVEGAWKDCDIIIENDYHTTPHDHAYLETECGMAWMDENGVVTLRVGTQVLEHYRTIARILGLPHTKVRNMSVMMGGGFGGKEDITVETYLALLTYKTRRPVKMVWTREESLEVHAKRHPEYLHYKTGATKDGKILCQEAHIIMDGGSYTYLTPWVQMYSTINGPGPYNIPNLLSHSVSAFTNNTLSSANRGFGATQVNFAYERQMDELARALNMDPYEIRLKNVVKNGDEISTGFVLEGHIALTEMIKKIREKLEATPKPDRLPDGRKVGRGIAVGQMSYGRLCFLHDSSRCAIRVELDGTITLRAGVPDVGAGQASALAQICAEELGLPIEDVHPFIMDTHLTPLCGTSTATRQLYMAGNACIMATRFVRDIIARKAAKLLDCNPDELTFRDKQIVFINDPQKSIPFVTVVGHVSNDGELLFHEAQFNAPFTEVPDLTNIKGRIHPDMTFTGHGVEIAVDEETGEYEVLRIIACMDCGKALNRNSVEGQMEGGAVYNLGWLREDLRWQKGVTKGNSFSTYLIPTSVDTPDVETVVIESGGGLGPYGAKGVGEPSDNTICPACVNAINDAIGVSFHTTLVKPEQICLALHEKKQRGANG